MLPVGLQAHSGVFVQFAWFSPAHCGGSQPGPGVQSVVTPAWHWSAERASHVSGVPTQPSDEVPH